MTAHTPPCQKHPTCMPCARWYYATDTRRHALLRAAKALLEAIDNGGAALDERHAMRAAIRAAEGGAE